MGDGGGDFPTQNDYGTSGSKSNNEVNEVLGFFDTFGSIELNTSFRKHKILQMLKIQKLHF